MKESKTLMTIVVDLTATFYYYHVRKLLFYYLLLVLIATTEFESERSQFVDANSINYGIYQTPITDINLLMPKLCQNQSTICEGSFCIPGIRRCVCDLRMPVQFDRYCLKQVDIDTKCFVTSQCNHTVKDAICVDINSNAILDIESSRFKLDQWQQLNELRQLSKSSLSSGLGKQLTNGKEQLDTAQEPKSISLLGFSFYDEPFGSNIVELRDDVIKSDVRNSPYEINYNTPELLHQNHTRRRYDMSADRNLLQSLAQGSRMIQSELPVTLPTTTTTTTTSHDDLNQQSYTTTTAKTTASPTILPTTDRTILSTNADLIETTTTPKDNNQSTTLISETTTPLLPNLQTETIPTTNVIFTTTTSPRSTTPTSELKNRKLITKSQSWPPGICSCPFGHIFSSKLRKCMIPSLVDSHCSVDYDCKQIPLTHCSRETRKCICDEPLIWIQSTCVRLGQQDSTTSSNQQTLKTKHKPLDNHQLELGATEDTGSLLSSNTFSFLENASLSIILVLVFFIIGILIVVEFVKCFSGSNNSTLISPRRQQNDQKHHKVKQATSNSTVNGLIHTNTTSTSNPKSPYATLRRNQENNPNSQLSNFTQATRGRILNYDFEQEGNGGIKNDSIGSQSQTQSNSTATNALKITFLFIV